MSDAGSSDDSSTQTGTAYQHFEKLYNSRKLSDVTIRYGTDGERVFHGHKFLLCSISDYFDRMLTGNWQEAATIEVTLKGDEPKLVEESLCYAYHKSIWLPQCDSIVLDNAIFCLDLNQLADKYDFPTLSSASILKLADEIVEFGRDVVVWIAEETERELDFPKSVQVGFMEEVKCTTCEEKWMKDIRAGDDGPCWRCGKWVNGWQYELTRHI